MAQKQGSTIRAYEQDPHGDLSVITDTTGTPTGTISYDPWGTVDGAIGTDAQQSLLASRLLRPHWTARLCRQQPKATLSFLRRLGSA
jgi:hypothetical protein